jgi:hypothetical protein
VINIRAPFTLLSKRCRIRTLAIVLAQQRRYGRPTRDGASLVASSPGLCVDCGTYFHSETRVVYASYGDPVLPQWVLVHETCPSLDEVLESLRETYDERLVTHVARAGRRVGGCGHVVDDETIYLVHATAEDALELNGTWVCRRCAQR